MLKEGWQVTIGKKKSIFVMISTLKKNTQNFVNLICKYTNTHFVKNTCLDINNLFTVSKEMSLSKSNY